MQRDSVAVTQPNHLRGYNEQINTAFCCADLVERKEESWLRLKIKTKELNARRWNNHSELRQNFVSPYKSTPVCSNGASLVFS